MRLRYYWPGSTLYYRHPLDDRASRYGGKARDLFWLTATLDESFEKLFPLMSDDVRAACQEAMNETPFSMEDSFLRDGELSFIATGPTSQNEMLTVTITAFAESAMWGRGRPWLKVGRRARADAWPWPEGIEVEGLDKLHEIGWDISRDWHLER